MWCDNEFSEIVFLPRPYVRRGVGCRDMSAEQSKGGDLYYGLCVKNTAPFNWVFSYE